MTTLGIALAALGLIAAVISLVDLVRHRQRFTRAALCAWILIVVIVPLIGSIFYWVLRLRAGPEAEHLVARDA